MRDTPIELHAHEWTIVLQALRTDLMKWERWLPARGYQAQRIIDQITEIEAKMNHQLSDDRAQNRLPPSFGPGRVFIVEDQEDVRS